MKGELIAAGSAADPSSGVSSVALAAFLPTGALDAKFGGNGKIAISVGGVDDAASAMAIDGKGNILVGGYSATGSAAAGTLSANFLLLRYTSAGKLDDTFGAHGIVTTSFNQPAAISSDAVRRRWHDRRLGQNRRRPGPISIQSGSDLAVARLYTDKGQPIRPSTARARRFFPVRHRGTRNL